MTFALGEKLICSSSGTGPFASAGTYDSTSAFGPFRSAVKYSVVCRRIAFPSSAGVPVSNRSTMTLSGLPGARPNCVDSIIR